MRALLLILIIPTFNFCRNEKVKYSGLNDLIVGTQQIVLYENKEFYLELGAGGAKGSYQIQNDTVLLDYRSKPENWPDKILITDDLFLTIENKEHKRPVKINRTDNKAKISIQNEGAFECNEFWIDKNTEWQFAYDSVKYCSSELILKSKDSIFGVLFPGSLSLRNDTILVNQEEGFPNTCIKIGKIDIGGVSKIGYQNENLEFKFINDTIIEFDKRQFVHTEKTILYGCWCNWK